MRDQIPKFFRVNKFYEMVPGKTCKGYHTEKSLVSLLNRVQKELYPRCEKKDQPQKSQIEHDIDSLLRKGLFVFEHSLEV